MQGRDCRVELTGNEYEWQRRVKRERTRARAPPPYCIARFDVHELSTLVVEPIDEDAVDAEVRCEHESVGGMWDDAVRMRVLLARGHCDRADVLHQLCLP